ncbi:MAG: YbaB/EbfC family nucleoid-associated protein [Candidatus Saganbacteria bacterium]|nr:YbaB/EbfC family nucleoid-associated protein [Candidatus Saganbacteria bacterium]
MAFGQMGDMIKQAREMQSRLKKIKEELKQSRYEDERGGVKVIVDGEMEIKELIIAPTVAPNQISKLVKDVTNGALKKSKNDAAGKLKQAAGGMNIPGLT